MRTLPVDHNLADVWTEMTPRSKWYASNALLSEARHRAAFSDDLEALVKTYLLVENVGSVRTRLNEDPESSAIVAVWDSIPACRGLLDAARACDYDGLSAMFSDNVMAGDRKKRRAR